MQHSELIQRIKQTAYLEGEFTLRSGRKSSYYLDKYRFETQPDILVALAEEFARYIQPTTTHIAGAELGGVPLAAATSLVTGLPFIIVRNARKDYGTDKPLEGLIESGSRVLLVEDVATTGGQVLEAAKTIQDSGSYVEWIVAVIDRQEGARGNIEAAGFEFHAILNVAELGLSVARE